MLTLALLLACTPEDPWIPPVGGVVDLQTDDGITLRADYTPAANPSRPAVVLVHMIPPNFDRTSWPEAFVQLLATEDWSVLAIDRRGAGESDGDAVDAYQGPLGRLDVAAAVGKLVADGAGDIVLIGASNGTTSVADYASDAAAEGWTPPTATGFLSAGPYTENQQAIGDMPVRPSFFMYENSDRERSWAEGIEPDAPDAWEFWFYDPGAHGTNQLGRDGIDERIRDWVRAVADTPVE